MRGVYLIIQLLITCEEFEVLEKL